MEITLKSDIKELTRKLDRIQKKQIPFAASDALNSTAFDARKSIQDSLPVHLDRPTPRLVSSVQVKKSTKKNLIAVVGFPGRGFGKTKWKETPADIMSRHIRGGTRRAKRRALAVPTKHTKLNKYGNIANIRGKIQKYLADKDRYFSGIPKGMAGDKNAGIWQRMPPNSKRKKKKKKGKDKVGKIRMIIAWEPRTQYAAGRFPLKRIVGKSVKKHFEVNFDKSLRYALSTAK